MRPSHLTGRRGPSFPGDTLNSQCRDDVIADGAGVSDGVRGGSSELTSNRSAEVTNARHAETDWTAVTRTTELY